MSYVEPTASARRSVRLTIPTPFRPAQGPKRMAFRWTRHAASNQIGC
jgi:hypothetical protein